MVEILAGVDSKTSTNDYASAVIAEIPPQISRVLIWLKEENTNALAYKILGSNEASYDSARAETLKAETTLAKNGSAAESCTDAWKWVEVQFKASAGGSQGALTVSISGSG